MDQQKTKTKVPFSQKWGQIKQLVGSRMMIGIYLGQYCINALTYFFITWFPVYTGAGSWDDHPQSRFCCLNSGRSVDLWGACWGA